MLFSILLGSIEMSAQINDLDKLGAQSMDPLKISTEKIFQDDSFLIPPLNELIDSALIHSPLLKQFDSEVRLSELSKETTKYSWTENIYSSADVKYGSTDNVVFSNVDNIFGNQINAVVTTRYSLGLGIRLSLFDVTQRKRQMAIAEEQYNYALARRDEVVRQIRQEVTLAFNALILSQRILTIKSETQQAKLLHFNMAEKQFLEGEITVADYSKIIEMIARSSQEYEEAKMEFKNNYFLLEEAVGVKLEDITKSKQ